MGVTFHTRYVSTHDNPADLPSRGTYGPTSLLLPPIAIPSELAAFVVNYDAPNLEPPPVPLAKFHSAIRHPYTADNDSWIAEFLAHD